MSKGPELAVAPLLRELGFNETEALAYCDLLRHPGATGYRVAQSIGKAQASAYAALAGLEAKGAVIIDEGETRAYRAVPPHELLGRLRRGFDRTCEEAERLLSTLAAPASDDRVYQLRHADQVFEHARTLLAEAQETVLFQLFPEPFAVLRQDFAATAARGVKAVGLMIAEEPPIEGIRFIQSRRSANVRRRWPGHQVTLIVDARRFLVALIERDGRTVRHALLADSSYLASLFHNGILSDVILHSGASIADFESPNGFMFGGFPPGLRELLGEQ